MLSRKLVQLSRKEIWVFVSGVTDKIRNCMGRTISLFIRAANEGSVRFFNHTATYRLLTVGKCLIRIVS